MKSIKKEFIHGIEYYNEQGYLHRTDGHAREYNDGSKEWYSLWENHEVSILTENVIEVERTFNKKMDQLLNIMMVINHSSHSDTLTK
jgi:hypothetical protein